MNVQTLVRKLVRQVAEEVARHPGRRVVSLRVHVSELSGVESAALSLAYVNAVRHTPLHGTEVIIETDAPEAICDQCGNKFRFESSKSECDKCGSMRLSLHGGEQFYLDSVLMED
jgi:Zn finger protein HypA/HybF involved in hydrogenase expression